MTALATIEDLFDRLVDISGIDQNRAESLLLDASAAVRRYTGQHFTLVENDEVKFRARRGVVVLSQRPVVEVTSVVDLNGNAVLYSFDGIERIALSPNVPDTFAWEPWRNGLETAVITYTHGYTTIPQDVVAIVCQAAARAYGRDPRESGIQQEAIAGYSYSIGPAAAAGAVGLLPGEKEILDVYRRRVGMTVVGP